MTATDDRGHADLMNAVYRRQRRIYDLTRKYFLFGRDRLIAELAPPADGHVLEVACGTGRNLAKIRKAYPNTTLYGLDISSEMLISARAALGAGVQLAEADACSFDPETLFGQADFDRIVISFAVSMIPEWEAALAEATRHLAPGGTLLVVDFGDQTDWPGWFRNALHRWLAKFHVSPRTDLGAVFERLADGTGGQARVTRIMGDYARLATLTVPDK
ncbi:MAG: methyltransferase domain-containing protein [Pseudomonadota bacterium]